jgi:hypothetical protein
MITVADISVFHPLSVYTLSPAAAEAGAAASRRDQQKRNAYARVEHNGYGCVPCSVESYGRLGKPVVKLLHDLGDEAGGPGGATRASFVAGSLRVLSVGKIRGSHFMYRACVGELARVTGQSLRTGMTVTTDEPLVEAICRLADRDCPACDALLSLHLCGVECTMLLSVCL